MVGTNNESTNVQYFEPHIPGLSGILCGKKGFAYYPGQGLNIVVHGPAGSGKTLFALQTAIGALRSGKNVIYLTKDTEPDALLKRLQSPFDLFGAYDLHEQKRANSTIKSRTLIPRAKDKNGQKDINGQKVHVSLLDELMEGLDKDKQTKNSFDKLVRDELGLFKQQERTFAFGRLGLLESGAFDRYAATTSTFEGLARLCPRLRPIFDSIRDQIKPPEDSNSTRNGDAADIIHHPWQQDYLVVYDSLPLNVLEECLRTQIEWFSSSDTPPSTQNSRCITLFIMESQELPDSMTASFPPDVQIKLAFREELHGKRTRTIQILKSRFQPIQGEPFPFTIHDNETVKNAQTSESIDIQYILDQRRAAKPISYLCDPFIAQKSAALEKLETIRHKTGITVFPSLPSIRFEVQAENSKPKTKGRGQVPLTFGCKSIDDLTEEKHLSSGGTTLLVTENRCNSTILGLHFLLGTLGNYWRHREEERQEKPLVTSDQLPHSVLYIALDDDIIGVLHHIWRYRTLHTCLFSGTEDAIHWKAIETAIKKEQNKEHSHGKHQLYKIPIRHPLYAPNKPTEEASKSKTASQKVQNENPYRAYLYIIVPDLVWCSPEEALQSIRWLLDHSEHIPEKSEDPEQCLRIDRIVLNRVSRIQANWPLIQDPTLLISNLGRICTARHIDFMIIDDTAIQSETTGHIESRWQSIARNIIRLRRVPLHGTEIVGMEMVRTNGTKVKEARPMELRTRPTPLVIDKGETVSNFMLEAADTFRGYTGIFSGKPKRCKTTVDLTYDQKDTPLHHDGLNMKRNLEAIMEDTQVNVMGPEERPGVNSALSNLSEVSHDSCHVVSVDEIWLHRLIRGAHKSSGIVAFSPDELQDVLPEHIRLKIMELSETDEEANKRCNTGSIGTCTNNSQWSLGYVGQKYATQALSIATRKAALPERGENTPKGQNQSSDETRNEKDAPFFGIPFRHNWGVLSVTRFREEYSQEVKKFFFKDALGNDILHFLQENSKVPCFTWESLAELVKATNYCILNTTNGHSTMKFALFDFHRATADSIVCFFLELLLDCSPIDAIFTKTNDVTNNGFNFFRFKTGEDTISAFCYALNLMRSLLSTEQRHEIITGLSPSSSDEYLPISVEVNDIGDIRFRPKAQPSPQKRTKIWSLFSREWLTTVPQAPLHQECPVQTYQLACLPISSYAKNVNVLRDSVYFNDDPDAAWRTNHAPSVFENRGVTMSGTWYLSIMSGGNRELAADVIRELVSDYHEMDRMLSNCGAPVSLQLYQDIYDESNQIWAGDLPYADLIRWLSTHNEGKTDNEFLLSKNIFPFCRSRIRNYTTIALILYKLTYEAMRHNPVALDEGMSDHVLQKLVRLALKRIDIIQK